MLVIGHMLQTSPSSCAHTCYLGHATLMTGKATEQYNLKGSRVSFNCQPSVAVKASPGTFFMSFTSFVPVMPHLCGRQLLKNTEHISCEAKEVVLTFYLKALN